MSIVQDRWKAGVEHEISFWRACIAQDAASYGAPRQLSGYIARRVTRPGSRIVDLGSGAWCRIGSRSDVHVVAADIHADEYMSAWRDAGVQPAVPIEKQDLTALTYPDESFDVVHCSNALDHTVSPFRAIEEMKRVCKPGGWVILRYYVSVGTRYNYVGLHQWNFTPKGGDVLIWSDHDPDSRWMSSLLHGVQFSTLQGPPAEDTRPQRMAEWMKW
jgi:ubiquinone/menaquinone biosynthesis C-methylase UbiE